MTGRAELSSPGMPDEQGCHAVAARDRESRLIVRLHCAAQSDHLVGLVVDDAADHVRTGRQRLDTLDAELRDVLNDPPATDTPAGARQFQAYLACKAHDILRIVSETVAHNRLQAKRLRSSGPGYGVPAQIRDRINRQTLAEDVNRVEHPTGDLTATDLIRYTNALRVREALTANCEDGAQPVLLVIYEPQAFDGRGRAAIALGDPDTADNTTVLVPGTHSSVRDGYLTHPDGRNIYHEAVRAAPERTTSVILWMGYRTPDGLLDPAVAQPAAARAGGRLLAADIDALTRSHIGASHITVVGHSYGATTVADAAASCGMRADDVVLVGSPGTDLAHSARDFHLPDNGHVYVGAASSDPITGFGGEPQLRLPRSTVIIGLGDDPAVDGYGSTRFKAEPPAPSVPLSGHNSYFDLGGESLYSIGDIASGHGDALATHHMTAPHRLRLPAFDPERLRPGTSAHRH